MKKNFDSLSIPLAQVLQEAESGSLQLPDFQRSWVWSDDQIRSLLASVSLAYPIGALMTLRTGNPDVRFGTRPLEGISLAQPRYPSSLLLDGQQRLTSLYLALKSPRPVPIRDARGKEMGRHYYADIRKCVEGGVNREEGAIISVPEDRVIRTDFHRKVALDLSTREGEIAASQFPLDQILDTAATMKWTLAYLAHDPARYDIRLERWQRFHDMFVAPITQCQIPVIALSSSNTRVAVCRVFEKVNTGGVVLTVFELLTATYAADNFNLRKDWTERQQNSFGHPLLSKLEEPAFLQLVTLLATYDRRRRHLEKDPDAERPPAVSCHRADMLKLSLEAYRDWADRAVRGLRHAARFLMGEGFLRWRDLPYATQLVPLAAILAVRGDAALSKPEQARLRQWYWCGVLGEMYGGPAPTRIAKDLQEVVPWLRGGRLVPRTVQEAQFQAERLLSLRTRNSAAYKGIYVLLLRSARDLGSGERVDPLTFPNQGFDVRHIFPKGWCQRQDPAGDESAGLPRPIKRQYWNCIVNKTPLPQQRHRFFGRAAPSRDLMRLEKQFQTSPETLSEFARTHRMDAAALRQDDFRTFFNRRFEALLDLVGEAMGKAVNRTERRDESPFFEPEDDPAFLRERVARDIRGGESRWVEFKSTAVKNLHTGRKDPFIENAILKTICAFLNTDGGTLLVGVDDNGSHIGINQDYPFVKGNRDGWERHLLQVVGTRLGPSAADAMRIRYARFGMKTVARIEVPASPKPVFVKQRTGEGKVLYARVGNTTLQKKGPDLIEYIGARWPA